MQEGVAPPQASRACFRCVQLDVAGGRAHAGDVGTPVTGEIGNLAVGGGHAAGIEDVAAPVLAGRVVR